MTLRHTLLLASLLVLTAPGLASADAIPPDVQACDMQTMGAMCTIPDGSRAMGTCAMDTCHRLDYAHWDRDASTGPPSVAYDCVRCVVGGPTDGGPSASDAGHGDMAPPRTGCSASPARAGGLVWLVLAALGMLARRR